MKENDNFLNKETNPSTEWDDIANGPNATQAHTEQPSLSEKADWDILDESDEDTAQSSQEDLTNVSLKDMDLEKTFLEEEEEKIDLLLKRGVSADTIIEELMFTSVRYYDKLIAYGASPDVLMRNMSLQDVASHCESLLEHGASADLMSLYMYEKDVAKYCNLLLEHGAQADRLACRMSYSNVVKHYGLLKEYGVSAMDLKIILEAKNSLK